MAVVWYMCHVMSRHMIHATLWQVIVASACFLQMAWRLFGTRASVIIHYVDVGRLLHIRMPHCNEVTGFEYATCPSPIRPYIPSKKRFRNMTNTKLLINAGINVLRTCWKWHTIFTWNNGSKFSKLYLSLWVCNEFIASKQNIQFQINVRNRFVSNLLLTLVGNVSYSNLHFGNVTYR